MSTAIKWFGVALATFVLLAGRSLWAETVSLRSGNGSVGGNDSLISMLLGPSDAAFATAFTPSDFSAADSGPAASIIANNGAWIAALPSDSQARWISTSLGGAGEGGTALYAIDFSLASAASSASLMLQYAVDNALGGGPNQGVFLNGMPISGNSSGGTFTSEFSITRSDIAPLLVAGTNTLYINSTDQGGPGGLIFSATIETTPIPEPAALALLGIGSSGLIAFARRRRRSDSHS